MKILCTGASGLFGQAFRKLLSNNNAYTLYSAYNHTPIEVDNSIQLDITNKKDVQKRIENVNPDLIVHAAALTAVDKCEETKKKAYLVNAKGTEYVANEASRIEAKLVYISTDYVFDGKKGCYTEDDETNPINYYGTTKLAGEKAVQQICNDYIIARTSVLYGSNKDNFATWAINKLANNSTIRVVNDQWVSPTFTRDVTQQVLALINADANGVYHTAGAERVNRFEFIKRLAEVFEFDKKLVQSTTIDTMNWIAMRPADSSLDISKISNIHRPLDVKAALKLLKQEMT